MASGIIWTAVSEFFAAPIRKLACARRKPAIIGNGTVFYRLRPKYTTSDGFGRINVDSFNGYKHFRRVSDNAEKIGNNLKTHKCVGPRLKGKISSSTDCKTEQLIPGVLRCYQNIFTQFCKVQFSAKRCTNIQLAFTQQLNAIAAHRLKRVVQTMVLYSRLGYDHHSLRYFLGRFAGGISNRLQRLRTWYGVDKPLFMIFAAVAFNWDEHNITNSTLEETAKDMGLIRRFSDGFMNIDISDKGLKGWEKVIDKANLTAFRKPLPNSSYLYEYKVFGTFTDIPARAFYNAQIDLDHRKQWDRLVISLEVVDRDESSGTEVVRWITHFPYPMYQREYVYARRSMIDQERKMIVLVNSHTEHPDYPVTDKYVRVTEYKSQMVIKPHGNSFDELGFDYVLTYYDDPQAAFPGFAYKWMAQKGVPDFVNKMHMAAKNIHERNSFKSSIEEENYSDHQRHPM